MDNADPSPPWWKAPWKFLTETVVDVFIFGVIGAAAVGLNLLVVYLSDKGIDSAILIGLKCAEYGLFVTDIVLFGRFLWKTGWRTWKEL